MEAGNARRQGDLRSLPLSLQPRPLLHCKLLGPLCSRGADVTVPSQTNELFVADYDAMNIRVVNLETQIVTTLLSTPYPVNSIALVS